MKDYDEWYGYGRWNYAVLLFIIMGIYLGVGFSSHDSSHEMQEFGFGISTAICIIIAYMFILNNLGVEVYRRTVENYNKKS